MSKKSIDGFVSGKYGEYGDLEQCNTFAILTVGKTGDVRRTDTGKMSCNVDPKALRKFCKAGLRIVDAIEKETARCLRRGR